MNNVLRKLAVVGGLGVLAFSMLWSQDGFNFDIAGDSGYGNMAIFMGWFLAAVVSIIEFVFSSNYRELNPTLIFFGVLAYAYSIYTNYQGILHFQGESQSIFGAVVLAVVMDGVAEPLIAWGLYESRTGDFIGNLIKAVAGSPNKNNAQNDTKNYHNRPQNYGNSFRNTQGISSELLEKLSNNSRFPENLHRVKNNHGGHQGNIG